MQPSSWILIAGGGLLIYALWVSTRQRWKVRIQAGPRGIQSYRGLAQAQVGRVAEFFERDVSLDAPVVIHAKRDSNGKLLMKFSGNIDAGTQQQIRNFLLTAL